MKAKITFFFLAIWVLTQTEFHQLLKLPILVAHFQEHKTLNKDITLKAFLREHYVGHTVMDNDTQRDNQLPFKTTDFMAAGMMAILPVQLDLRQEVVFIEKEFNILPHNHPGPGALKAIFQPPRLA